MYGSPRVHLREDKSPRRRCEWLKYYFSVRKNPVLSERLNRKIMDPHPNVQDPSTHNLKPSKRSSGKFSRLRGNDSSVWTEKVVLPRDSGFRCTCPETPVSAARVPRLRLPLPVSRDQGVGTTIPYETLGKWVSQVSVKLRSRLLGLGIG